MTTLTNPNSWADLFCLIDCAHFEEVDDTKQLVIDFQIPEEYTSTTRTLLRRILREIDRKILLIESTLEQGTWKQLSESVYTNITKEEYELARKIYLDTRDYDIEEEWVVRTTTANRPAHNNSSPSDDDSQSQQSDSSEEEPSPQPLL